MALPKSMRLLAVATVGIFIYLCLLIFQAPATVEPPSGMKLEKMTKDPNLDRMAPTILPLTWWLPMYTDCMCIATSEPPEPLHRVVGNNYAPDNPNSDRINATLLALVRNSELKDMLMSIRDLERTFNRKFNYPWLFLNDEPFTEEFKEGIRAATKAEVKFGKCDGVK
jgi:mannosyltransferase